MRCWAWSIFCLGLAINPARAQRALPPGSFRLPPDILPSPSFPDLVKAGEQWTSIHFEKEHVRVVRIHLGADDRIPTREAGSGTVVCLSECHLRFLRPDRKFVEVYQNASGAQWVYGDLFSVVNLTDLRTELLLIESKDTDHR